MSIFKKKMVSKAENINDYIAEIEDANKKELLQKLRTVILKNLPKKFEECMNYGMIGYVVPHSIYPKGYHCTPQLPLPFMALAAQKNSVNFYHMGIYADKNLMDWFATEYAQNYSHKLDMGKSCMRFKKEEQVPFALIGELVKKMSVEDWIAKYESLYVKKK